jgi:DnaJ-class molecular chaperone
MMFEEERPIACLAFGIYEKGPTAVIERRECSVCHGDHCPYVVEAPEHGPCPDCFGTGRVLTENRLDLRDSADILCRRCGGTGKI